MIFTVVTLHRAARVPVLPIRTSRSTRTRARAKRTCREAKWASRRWGGVMSRRREQRKRMHRIQCNVGAVARGWPLAVLIAAAIPAARGQTGMCWRAKLERVPWNYLRSQQS